MEGVSCAVCTVHNLQRHKAPFVAVPTRRGCFPCQAHGDMLEMLWTWQLSEQKYGKGAVRWSGGELLLW